MRKPDPAGAGPRGSGASVVQLFFRALPSEAPRVSSSCASVRCGACVDSVSLLAPRCLLSRFGSFEGYTALNFADGVLCAEHTLVGGNVWRFGIGETQEVNDDGGLHCQRSPDGFWIFRGRSERRDGPRARGRGGEGSVGAFGDRRKQGGQRGDGQRYTDPRRRS